MLVGFVVAEKARNEVQRALSPRVAFQLVSIELSPRPSQHDRKRAQQRSFSEGPKGPENPRVGGSIPPVGTLTFRIAPAEVGEQSVRIHWDFRGLVRRATFPSRRSRQA